MTMTEYTEFIESCLANIKDRLNKKDVDAADMLEDALRSDFIDYIGTLSKEYPLLAKQAKLVQTVGELWTSEDSDLLTIKLYGKREGAKLNKLSKRGWKSDGNCN